NNLPLARLIPETAIRFSEAVLTAALRSPTVRYADLAFGGRQVDIIIPRAKIWHQQAGKRAQRKSGQESCQ
ncbi:MAG: hypothetical protein WBX02_14615, partial [Terriglobales bacterium]